MPDYAWPLFLRLVPSLALTETFKQKKSDLAAQGFDPGQVADPLYADPGDGYVALDTALHARITAGQVRF